MKIVPKDIKNSDRKLQNVIGVPISVLIQEASNLYGWVQEDRKMLMKAGLAWKLVEDIPDQVEKCKDLAAQWYVVRNERSKVAEQCKTQLKDARDLHAQIRRGYRYAFRENKTLLKKVFALSGYRKNSQIIQDLSNLCIVGRENKKLLDRINFDYAMVDKAAFLSDNLGEIISERENEKAERLVFYETVKTSCLALKESVSQIRACGNGTLSYMKGVYPRLQTFPLRLLNLWLRSLPTSQ